MSLEKSLLAVLNNDEEPLCKRLKIANNAFNSVDVHIDNREMFLLKWLSNVSASNNSLEAWKQVHQWLFTHTIYETHASEMVGNDIQAVFRNIAAQFDTQQKEILDALLAISLGFCNIPVVQHYCLNHNDVYIEFLTKTLNNLQDMDILVKFITKEKLLGKRIFMPEKFGTIFWEHILPILTNVCGKYATDDLVNTITQIISQHIFEGKVIPETTNLKESELIKLIPNLKQENLNLYYYHKLIFNAFCKVHKDNKNTSDFFMFLIQNLGFSFNEEQSTPNVCVNNTIDLRTSLEYLIALLECLQIHNLKFSEMLSGIMLSIISTTKLPCNEHCFKVINLILQIDPIGFEKNITTIIYYLLLADNSGHAQLYSAELKGIFDLFHKMHRIPTLLSKIIRAFLPVFIEHKAPTFATGTISFNGVAPKIESDYIESDIDKILPENVLNGFKEYTVGLTNAHIALIFKTCIFHMNELATTLAEKSNDVKYVLMVQIVSKLLINFMMTINITSINFLAPLGLEKIINLMRDLSETLGKFGNSLVAVEHNHDLMCVFLNLCCTWGELKIYLEHNVKKNKLVNGEEQEENIRTDFTTCNISLLHSYLPSKTWCLIAERISNFGDVQCKEIMGKLWLQKLRVLVLSEVSPELLKEHNNSLIKALNPIEEYYKYLIMDNFARKKLLPCIDSSGILKIANCLIKSKDISLLCPENTSLAVAITYSLFKRISKLLKKEGRRTGKAFVSCELFSKIKHSLDENYSEILSQAIALDKKQRVEITISEKLIEYIEVLKKLPIYYFETSKRIVIVQYLCGLRYDLEQTDADDCKLLVDEILLGVMAYKDIMFEDILPTEQLTDVVMHFGIYKPMLANLVATSTVDQIRKYAEQLQKQSNIVKYCNCVPFLCFKVKVLNDYKVKFCQRLLSLLRANYDSLVLETLAAVLSSNPELTEELVEQLWKLMDRIFSSNEDITIGHLQLFYFALQNQQNKHFEEIITEAVVDNIIKCLEKIELSEQIVPMYASIIIFMLKSERKEFVKKINEDTISALDHPEKRHLYLNLWQILMGKLQLEAYKQVGNTVNTLIIRSYEYMIAGDLTGIDVFLQIFLKISQNTKILLNSAALDVSFATISLYVNKCDDFDKCFRLCVKVLEVVLTNRLALVQDRLPVFLQNYRHLLHALARQSDTTKEYDTEHYENMSELAHLFEKLTHTLVKQKTNVASVNIYLIADFLKQYETITLYPGVKLRFEKCLFNLLKLSSPHTTACLMRMLNTGCQEIFKTTYENYKKYHKFTGKV